MNPQIVYTPKDESDFVQIPIATATSLTIQGSLCSYESSYIVLLDAAAEDATFCGVNILTHTANEASPELITTALKATVIYDCTSATYGFADGLTYASANAVVDDGGYNTICFSARLEASAVTRLRCLIDVVALGKLFAVAA